MGYWTNLMAAMRGRQAQPPQPNAQLTPFYFPFYSTATGGVNRPVPKLTLNFSKLRSLSESPIPRRAIDYVKNQISMLDWDVAPKDGSVPTGEQKKNIEVVKAILNRPNNNESWRTFIEQIVEDLLVIGYAAIEKRDWATNMKRPLVLYPFDSSSLQLYSDWDGSPNKPRYAQVNQHADIIPFKTSQLMYVRYNPRTNTPWGLSPLEVAAQNVEYLINAQTYAGRMASNSTPRKALDLGEEIDPAQLEEIRNYWRMEVEGRGHMPIFGGSKGAKSIELGASNDEALFLKWQGLLINFIANSFGLDSQKFGAVLTSRATGDILDDSTDEGAIRPLMHSIAAAINRDIVEPLGFDDIEFMVRWTANYKDRKSLASIHQIYVQQDLLLLDEARKEIGLPPLPEGKGRYTLTEYRSIFGQMSQGQGTPAGVIRDMKEGGMTPTDGQQHPDTGDNQQSTNPNSAPKVETRSDKPVNKTANPSKVD